MFDSICPFNIAEVDTRNAPKHALRPATRAAACMRTMWNMLHTNMRYLTKERAYAAIHHDGPRALLSFDAMEHASSSDMEDCSDSHMPASIRSVLSEILLRS